MFMCLNLINVPYGHLKLPLAPDHDWRADLFLTSSDTTHSVANLQSIEDKVGAHQILIR